MHRYKQQSKDEDKKLSGRKYIMRKLEFIGGFVEFVF